MGDVLFETTFHRRGIAYKHGSFTGGEKFRLTIIEWVMRGWRYASRTETLTDKGLEVTLHFMRFNVAGNWMYRHITIRLT